jgi:hypothetical protein
MADPYVHSMGGNIKAEFAAAVLPGDLVYYDSSNTQFGLADADSNATPAQFVCIATNFFGASDKEGTISRHALIEDTDAASFTRDSIYFLSDTDGGNTATRPTTDDYISQIIGRGVTTTSLEVDIRTPWDVQVPTWRLGPGGGGTVDTEFDTGGSDIWSGTLLDADDEQDKWAGRFPSNFFTLTIAEWLFGADTSVQPNVNYVARSAHSAQDTDTHAETISDAAISGTPDFLEVDDVSSGMNVAGFSEPDAFFAMKLDHGSGTDEIVSFGLQLTARVV